MNHMDLRPAGFGRMDQLQRYHSNAADFHSSSQSTAASFNAASNCNNMMLCQTASIAPAGTSDPISVMHDFSMATAPCNVPIGLPPFHSGSNDLSSMLALSSGFQSTSGAFVQPHVNHSSALYPYLPTGSMQSFLQAATPAQFPLQNFSPIRGGFSGGLPPATARAFSCFRPVSVGEQSVVNPAVPTVNGAQYSHSGSFAFPGSQAITVGADNMRRQSSGSSLASSLVSSTASTVDQTVLNISSFLNLPQTSSINPSSGTHSLNGQIVPNHTDINKRFCDVLPQTSSNSGSSSILSASSSETSTSSSSRRRRTSLKNDKTNASGACVAVTANNHTDGDAVLSCSSQAITNSNSSSASLPTNHLVHNSDACGGQHIVVNCGTGKADYTNRLNDEDFMDGITNLPPQIDDVPPAESAVNVDDNQCIVLDGVRRWKCLQCPKVYSTKHNLVTHTLGHCGIKPHRCVTCGKYFKQISHLQTHVLTHASVKPHICTICNRGFTQASHVKRHMAVHVEQRLHTCRHCQRSFAFPSDLQGHIEKLHKNTENGALPLVCKTCHSVFETCESLRTHRLQVHRCRDQRILINTADGPVNSGSLMCNVCSKVFTYPSQLRDHALKHEGKRPFMCTECGMDFMKEHHLKAHQFTHTGLRPYICQVCGRAFNQKANLQRHQLVHDGDRKFACEVCGRGFTQMQVLRAHLVTHQETKPFQCKVCGKGFTRLHNLNGHLHMHDGDKPFVCVCGASFTLKGNLNRHKKDKHRHRDDQQNMMSSDSNMDVIANIDSVTNDELSGCTATGPLVSITKKKRKSMPPRKTVVAAPISDEQGHIVDEVTAAWQMHEDCDSDVADCDYDDDYGENEIDDGSNGMHVNGLTILGQSINKESNSFSNALQATRAKSESDVIMLENAELRTFSNLTAVSTFGFENGLHDGKFSDEDLGTWPLTNCIAVKSEDLGHINNDLTQITGSSSMNSGNLTEITVNSTLNVDGSSDADNSSLSVPDAAKNLSLTASDSLTQDVADLALLAVDEAVNVSGLSARASDTPNSDGKDGSLGDIPVECFSVDSARNGTLTNIRSDYCSSQQNDRVHNVLSINKCRSSEAADECISTHSVLDGKDCDLDDYSSSTTSVNMLVANVDIQSGPLEGPIGILLNCEDVSATCVRNTNSVSGSCVVSKLQVATVNDVKDDVLDEQLIVCANAVSGCANESALVNETDDRCDNKGCLETGTSSQVYGTCTDNSANLTGIVVSHDTGVTECEHI